MRQPGRCSGARARGGPGAGPSPGRRDLSSSGRRRAPPGGPPSLAAGLPWAAAELAILAGIEEADVPLAVEPEQVRIGRLVERGFQVDELAGDRGKAPGSSILRPRLPPSPRDQTRTVRSPAERVRGSRRVGSRGWAWRRIRRGPRPADQPPEPGPGSARRGPAPRSGRPAEEGFEGPGHLLGRGESVGRVGGHGLEADPPQRRGDAGASRAVRRSRSGGRGPRLPPVSPPRMGPCRSAGSRGGPEGEDVAPRADLLLLLGRVDPGLLGGHEGEGAAGRAGSSDQEVRSRAMPKSISRGSPDSSTRMFLGLMSRWTIPRRWAKSAAAATFATSAAAWRGDSGLSSA